MQNESMNYKKHKIDVVDSRMKTEFVEDMQSSRQAHMFVQIMNEYNYNYLVVIDPVKDAIMHKDLLEFEKSKIQIQMNNYDPQSLYDLYEDKIARPDRHVAWLKFFKDISLQPNPQKSENIVLNREDCYKIQKARWFVTFCER